VKKFFRECALKIPLTRSILQCKIHQKSFGGSFPSLLARLRGLLLSKRGGDRRGGKEKGKGEEGGKRKREEGEGEGKGGWCPLHVTCLHDAPVVSG